MRHKSCHFVSKKKLQIKLLAPTANQPGDNNFNSNNNLILRPSSEDKDKAKSCLTVEAVRQPFASIYNLSRLPFIYIHILLYALSIKLIFKFCCFSPTA